MSDSDSDSSSNTPDQNNRKRLPVNPSAENLRKQAKRLARIEPSLSLQQAQHKLAVQYGQKNWDELMHVVETMGRGAGQTTNVKNAFEPLPADANRSDLEAVRAILSEGAFTQHDLDLALARAVLNFTQRAQIAELLIEHGADPDGQYGSDYGPIVFVTGECLDPDGLQFLIDHGADVSFAPIPTKYGPATPMGHTLGSYVRNRNDRKRRCIDILLEHRAVVPAETIPAMLAIHRGDAMELADLIDRDPSLVLQNFPAMPYGNIALAGATLLHMAVDFCQIECVDVLIDCGADINARAQIIDGIGGQTPVFHAIATNLRAAWPMLQHLVLRYGRAIDCSVAATFRLYGEPQAELVTPLQYAERGLADDAPEWRRSTAEEVELIRSVARASSP
ncbi:MAG: ankyrin repeat domain-containing protein [Burkholderiales bacterium]|nr:ankyrin repeat domain-containing protein [Phycisphaerae bacterium]